MHAEKLSVTAFKFSRANRRIQNKKHHEVMPLIDWGRPNPYLQYSIERPLMSIWRQGYHVIYYLSLFIVGIITEISSTSACFCFSISLASFRACFASCLSRSAFIRFLSHLALTVFLCSSRGSGFLFSERHQALRAMIDSVIPKNASISHLYATVHQLALLILQTSLP